MTKNENWDALPQVLLPWYRENRRQLPWREDRNPYHVWLSEIMLQQTRVEAVKGYYSRFLTVLPDIRSLAECDDEVLHKLWEGLGYYSRVRNLKKCAQVIVSEYGGVFPREHAQVLALPGIGPYTAGAICSIAFDQSTPAVDGNVLRVVSRLRNDPAPIDLPETKKNVTEFLAGIYPPQAGDFTQGHGLRPQPEAGLRELPLQGLLSGFSGRRSSIPAGKIPQERTKVGGFNGFYFKLRRPLRPGKTA